MVAAIPGFSERKKNDLEFRMQEEFKTEEEGMRPGLLYGNSISSLPCLPLPPFYPSSPPFSPSPNPKLNSYQFESLLKLCFLLISDFFLRRNTNFGFRNPHFNVFIFFFPPPPPPSPHVSPLLFSPPQPKKPHSSSYPSPYSFFSSFSFHSPISVQTNLNKFHSLEHKILGNKYPENKSSNWEWLSFILLSLDPHFFPSNHFQSFISFSFRNDENTT